MDVDIAAIVSSLIVASSPNEAKPDHHGTNIDRQPPEATSQQITLTLPYSLKRRGNEMRLIIEGEQMLPTADPRLVAMVARAHIYLAAMVNRPELGSSGVARMFGVDRADVGRVLPLAFLAPRLLDQILTGRQSDAVSPRTLAREEQPTLWSEQVHAST